MIPIGWFGGCGLDVQEDSPAMLFLTMPTSPLLPESPRPTSSAPSSARAHLDWRLVWADEFDGTEIDRSKWEFEVNARGGGNEELQYYTDRPENAYVAGGMLNLVALRERFTGPEGTRDYTSARLRTKNRGDWCYGRIEVRARLPRGQGLWPAIWMMPTDDVYGGWAASGEIDIMELVGHKPAEVLGTLHYGARWPHNVHSGETYAPPSMVRDGTTFADGFHDFAIEWDRGEIRWYIDGAHTQTQRAWHTEGMPFPAPFDQRFHLLLNVAVGGKLPGNPDGTSVFPQTMSVEHVRVYQAC